MKTLCSTLVAWLLIGLNANAQGAGATLDKDPIFTTTLVRHIHYPVTAVRGSVYGRFYVKFSIDSVGSIQNIAVLYPKISTRQTRRLGFEHEILNGLEQLPQLSPRYKGNYILPIAFVYTNYNEANRPLLPTNLLPEKYLTDGFLLNEVRIVGQSHMYRNVRTESEIAPASRQVVLF